MVNYEINSSTQAIMPVDKKYSMVYEEEVSYEVEASSNKIIKNNCNFYGSSYLGRCEGTKSLTGIKSKYPIIIEESRKIIFFPTSSTRTKQAIWIALDHIKELKTIDGTNYIIFKNGNKIAVDVSIFSLQNQISRANLLKLKLYERVK